MCWDLTPPDVIVANGRFTLGFLGLRTCKVLVVTIACWVGGGEANWSNWQLKEFSRLICHWDFHSQSGQMHQNVFESRQEGEHLRGRTACAFARMSLG